MLGDMCSQCPQEASAQGYQLSACAGAARPQCPPFQFVFLCAGTGGSALGCEAVYELLLLALGVGTGLLHVEYKGLSRLSLLPSMRAADGTTTSSKIGNSGSSSSGRGSSSKRVAVSAHHEELLQVLVGVRQLAAMANDTAAAVAKQMGVLPLAVKAAGDARYDYSTSVSAGEGVGPGMRVPWQLALPMLLTLVELLALAPPYLTNQLIVLQQVLTATLTTCSQLHPFTQAQHWQPEQQPPHWPSLDTVQSHMQLCVQAVWLQLGPALLSLCRRSSGDAVGEDLEDGWTLVTEAGVTLGAASPHDVLAIFSVLLAATVDWKGGWDNFCMWGGDAMSRGSSNWCPAWEAHRMVSCILGA